jgi:hypothetical protein
VCAPIRGPGPSAGPRSAGSDRLRGRGRGQEKEARHREMRSKMDHIIRLAGLVDPHVPLDDPAEAAFAAAARQGVPVPPRRAPGIGSPAAGGGAAAVGRRHLSVSPRRRELAAAAAAVAAGGYDGAGRAAWYGRPASSREYDPALTAPLDAPRVGRVRPQSARAALQRRLDAAGAGGAAQALSAWGDPGPVRADAWGGP